MDWEKLKIFRYVAQEQSFTHAGIKLNLSQSAASRQIKKLEEDIGVMLFHRHARGLLLTEQGETLLKYANEVFDKISLAENSLTINKEKPEGSLRVATTITFGSVWLTSYIDEFLEKYPEYKEKVRLVMLAVPSRSNVPQYQKLKRETDELVGRINGKFATVSWTPIWYFYRALPFKDLIDLYISSEVALITPILLLLLRYSCL